MAACQRGDVERNRRLSPPLDAEPASAHAGKGVVLLFRADGGLGPMTGIDRGRIIEGKQLGTDAGQQRVEIAPGKIGPANGSLKKCIADKDALIGME